MTIRLLGGEAKGIELATPRGHQTRPTSVLLKRRFFDSFQDLEDCLFIDCCAGSGSMAFEALSRGAKEAIVVENSQAALRALKHNNQKFLDRGLKGVTIYPSDVFKALPHFLEKLSKGNNFLFFDPPYEKIIMYQKFFEFLHQSKLNTKVIVEACSQKTMPISKFETEFGVIKKSFKQGTSYFAIYEMSI